MANKGRRHSAATCFLDQDRLLGQKHGNAVFDSVKALSISGHQRALKRCAGLALGRSRPPLFDQPIEADEFLARDQPQTLMRDRTTENSKEPWVHVGKIGGEAALQ